MTDHAIADRHRVSLSQSNNLSLISRPCLQIDLAKIAANYAHLCTLTGRDKMSAVVKANAYGLGMAPIAKTLHSAGCNIFWVMHSFEGVELRSHLPNAVIYVLSGVASDSLDDIVIHRLRPVISTLPQLHFWLATTKGKQTEPVALHFDTGLNRLGIRPSEIQEALDAWQSGQLQVALVMSHLACADMTDHPMNQVQLEHFKTIAAQFPNIPTSFSASYGIFIKDPAFRQHLSRAGRALYGIKAPDNKNYLTQPAVKLSAPVLQIADLKVGETVGYAASWKAKRPTRTATLALGYADGVPFQLQNIGSVYFTDSNGRTYTAPVIGRVSMDLMTCDITEIPQSVVSEGCLGDLVTDQHYAEEIGEKVGSICYEIITRLGHRYQRLYLNG